MRLTHPTETILQHADDIDSAYRRILYHPDMAVACAYVLGRYLIVPVGQVFGSRNAPSYFCLTSDLRAYIASTQDLQPPQGEPFLPIVQATQLEQITLAKQMPTDERYSPLSSEEQATYINQTYVDDNAIAATADRMRAALQQTARSAYEIYGYPHENRRPDVMNMAKWKPQATVQMTFLGMNICTRTMTASWDKAKREGLQRNITEALASTRLGVSPKVIARILGKIQHASKMAFWGIYIISSLRRQLTRHQPSRIAIKPHVHTGVT